MEATVNVQPHYSTLRIESIDDLRRLFPSGEEADEMNFVMFSTSGVHGTYATIEDIEAGEADSLTVLVVQPRIVCMRYGHISVEPGDIPWLKKLRQSSALAAREAMSY